MAGVTRLLYLAWGVGMAKNSGYGAQLIRNGAEIAQVRDIAGPGMKQDAIDVTTREDGGQDQFLGGLRDGGQVTFDLAYDSGLAGHQAIPAAFAAGTVAAMQLRLTDAETPEGYRFDAHPTAFAPKTPMRGAQTADVTYQVTGAPVPFAYFVDHAGNYLVTHANSYLIA